MAQEMSGASAPKQMTASEMRQWIQDHDKALKNYAGALDPLKKLKDVTKPASRKLRSLTKENIVEYLQNPSSYEQTLINASWYIFYRSQIYQRIILYYSTLFFLDARTIIPKYDLIAPESDEVIAKSFNDTTKMLGAWNINNEFFKVIVTCMLQDVSYNCAYCDETGLFLLPLPADRCKIVAQYPSGDWQFAVDMTYFRGTNNWLIDSWGEPFVSMYRAYEAEGTAGKYQIMPEEYSCCLKFRSYDYQTIIPPFSGILGELINLNDVFDVAAIADKMDVYKLIYMKLKTITGAKMPDEFEVSPGVAIEYFNRILDDELIPDWASAAIVPGSEDLGVVDFSTTDHANETSKVLKATKNIYNTAGGAQVLNAAEVTGSTAHHSALHVDEDFSLTLLPQIQGWFNRIIKFVVTNPSTIKFFHVGRLTKDEYRKELLESAQYSLPTKLAVMSMNGIDPIEVLSLNHLEDDILKLGEKFINPLNSSYTSSWHDESGRPTSSDDEITDDGEKSRDKADRAN